DIIHLWGDRWCTPALPHHRDRVRVFVCVQDRDPVGVPSDSRSPLSMTTPTQPKSNPVPAILVYGTPSGPALTQASWFRAEDKDAVKAAAEALKFSVIELQTDADKALAAGAHEGVLKGSGRMIVGSVSAEVYRRSMPARQRAGPTRPSRTAPRRRRRRNPRQNKPRTHFLPPQWRRATLTRPPRQTPGMRSRLVPTWSGNIGKAMASRTVGGS